MTNFLHLPNWTVNHVAEQSGRYTVEATFATPPECCMHCGSVSGIQKHGTRLQEIIDVPSHGNRVRIALVRTRHRCKDCGKTFLQPLPDVADSGSMTKRLVAHIERQSLRFTFAHVAEEVGVDEKTVRNIFNEYTDWLDKNVIFETPKVLGLDEVFLLGKARCVSVNVEEATIVGVLEDRNKPTLHNYLFWLKDKEKIKVVTMDMWKPYKDAVQAVLPGAAIVVDKFHIVRTATHALESVRRGLRDTMSASKRREVMRSRFLLLKRAYQLTSDERIRVDEWTASLPTLGMAYRLKEGFYGVFDEKTRAAAEAAYDAWEKEIPPEMRTVFKEVTTAMKNWRGEVFAYFDHRFTNAVTEALNGITKIMNRNGRGYSFKAIRAKMLYNKHSQWTQERRRESRDALRRMDLLHDIPGELDARDQHLDDLIERSGPLPVKSYGALVDHLDSMLMGEDVEAAAPPTPTPKAKKPKRRK